ncbi:MAG: MFS transporter [Bifidobacterium psychraerophilum]
MKATQQHPNPAHASLGGRSTRSDRGGQGYTRTIVACFNGYVTQAVINNFMPLLFVTFSTTLGIGLGKLASLITLNFVTQLIVDVLAGKYVDRIGYKPCIVAAHVFAAAGLLVLGIVPPQVTEPYPFLVLAIVLYALGGGLIEVLVSPIVQGCPTAHKAKMMSLLHSFYCWGQVATVALSTLALWVLGIGTWPVLACLWALVPIAGVLLFLGAPIPAIIPEGSERFDFRQLLRRPAFIVFFIMMLCAGAAEQGMAQWASAFAETGLGVTKVIGDLAGPAAFAVMMGISRTIYGVLGHRINLRFFIASSAGLCIITYLVAGLAPSPVLGLIACALTGLSVGIMWPGTFSLAVENMPGGGTLMFALFAVAGDIGCAAGPALVGTVSAMQDDNLRAGLLAGTVFAVILLIATILPGLTRSRNAAPSGEAR